MFLYRPYANTSITLQPIAHAHAAPIIPTRGTRIYTTAVRMEIWIAVAARVVFN